MRESLRAGYTTHMPKGQEKEPSKTLTNSGPESIKDTRDISNVLQILDSQPIKTTPFGANISGENSYRRAERLSAALHLVTNHVPDTEPLRAIIRQKGLHLLTIILDLRSGFRAPASEKGQEALAAIRELISLARLLAVSGFVSAQNANAVAEALDELGSLIVVSQRSALADQLTISREHLIPPAGTSGFSRPERPHSPSIKPERVSQRSLVKDIKDITVPQEGRALGQRSERIVDILKAGGVLGIKDISSNLPQYSEKMVQRELSELVRIGMVQKVGSKRWSKYRSVR